ncbi:uncharacterized protein METZ01_LOCUS70592 [marine metagenome]|jgi:pimeloyl-ACP methyl ester carboxylesterase|uniref:AB hydrolase-1 domain-containing protein n=1 Tax=marine metagenome TaxID=408172 RepID=A0A381TQE8_9ZZZZ
MRPTVDALKSRCRVISFSLAGDSGRPFDRDQGFDAYLAQIEDVLQRAGVDDATVCGVSFGGLIALHWAARRPRRTTALILVSTPAPDFKPDRRLQRYLRSPRLFSPVFALQSPVRLGPEIWCAFDGTIDRLAFSARHLARITLSPCSPVRMAERAHLMSTVDFKAACEQVSAPTLVLTGEPELDRVVPVAGTRSYVDRITGTKEVTLNRTGHIGLVTRPQRFAEVVGQFVAFTNSTEEHVRHTA